jgi:hypothetical protein
MSFELSNSNNSTILTITNPEELHAPTKEEEEVLMEFLNQEDQRFNGTLWPQIMSRVNNLKAQGNEGKKIIFIFKFEFYAFTFKTKYLKTENHFSIQPFFANHIRITTPNHESLCDLFGSI